MILAHLSDGHRARFDQTMGEVKKGIMYGLVLDAISNEHRESERRKIKVNCAHIVYYYETAVRSGV